MKAQINQVVLVDEQDPDYAGKWVCERFETSLQPILDTLRKFRADYVEIKDRGNRLNSILLQISREHTSSDAAAEYITMQNQAVPNVGLLELTFYAADGSERHFFLVDAGVSQGTGGIVIGCTSTHSYSIVGGELLDKLP
jgi:hypothetical protein